MFAVIIYKNVTYEINWLFYLVKSKFIYLFKNHNIRRNMNLLFVQAISILVESVYCSSEYNSFFPKGGIHRVHFGDIELLFILSNDRFGSLSSGYISLVVGGAV